MAQGQDGSTIASAPVVASATYPTLGTDGNNPTLDVYGNAKCPYTREFVFSNLQWIVEDFVETGRLNVRFRNLAYNIGGGGSGYLTGADPTIAEGGIGIWNEDPQSWPQFFHDLFANQPSGSVSYSDMGSRAQSAGVSTSTPGSSGQYSDEVVSTAQEAGSVGVSFTPTLALGGDTKPGRNSEGNLRNWIEALIDSAPSNTQETESSEPETEESDEPETEESDEPETEESDEPETEESSEPEDEATDEEDADSDEETSEDGQEADDGQETDDGDAADTDVSSSGEGDETEDEAPACPFSG